MHTKNVLVVSNPPHGAVKEEVAAAILGLPVEEARLKVGFVAPEVLAASDPERAAELGASLEQAGVNVGVLDGDELAHLPWPELASSFGLGGEALHVQVGETVVDVPAKLATRVRVYSTGHGKQDRSG